MGTILHILQIKIPDLKILACQRKINPPSGGADVQTWCLSDSEACNDNHYTNYLSLSAIKYYP